MMNTTNKNSMKGRWVACIYRGLTLLTILLFMTGMRAFGQYSLANSTGITIASGEAINGYPSTIVVPTNVAGTLEKVTVTLNGFTEAYANGVDILLVAPNGAIVPLLGNDGQGQSVSGLTLTFDDVIAGAGTLSTTTPITSGTYRTGDNSPYGMTQPFPTLTGTSNANLASFVGLLPAGYTNVWSLYVLDESEPFAGSITSWSLNLYTTPTIGITNSSVTLNENTSTNFYFTVSDTTSNATLKPTVTLANVNNGNIGYTNASGSISSFVSPSDFSFTTINDNGTNVLTITPNANLYGTATFTINLGDANQTNSSQSISLTVNHVPVAPKISLANTTITTTNGIASTTNFISLISQDGNPGSSLIFSVVGTNGIGNIGVNSNVFTNIVGLPAATPPTIGITNNFYFSIVPGGFPIGTSYLNFIVTDPGASGLSATQTVTVIVNPLTSGPLVGPLVYANTNALNVQPSTTEPLGTITITNLTDIGLVGRVSVSVLGLTNVIPSGLVLYLVAPDGTQVPLYGPISGSSSPSTYAELTFADSVAIPNVQAANVLPAATSSTGSDLLTNYVLNSANGPSAIAAQLGGHFLTNTVANNVWTLYVDNSSSSEFGISGGWVLDVYPAPVLAEPAQTSITMPESASTNIVFVTSDTVGVPTGPPSIALDRKSVV